MVDGDGGWGWDIGWGMWEGIGGMGCEITRMMMDGDD